MVIPVLGSKSPYPPGLCLRALSRSTGLRICTSRDMNLGSTRASVEGRKESEKGLRRSGRLPVTCPGYQRSDMTIKLGSFTMSRRLVYEAVGSLVVTPGSSPLSHWPYPASLGYAKKMALSAKQVDELADVVAMWRMQEVSFRSMFLGSADFSDMQWQYIIGLYYLQFSASPTVNGRIVSFFCLSVSYTSCVQSQISKLGSPRCIIMSQPLPKRYAHPSP